MFQRSITEKLDPRPGTQDPKPSTPRWDLGHGTPLVGLGTKIRLSGTWAPGHLKEEGWGAVFAGGREMKIFSTAFRDFWKNMVWKRCFQH